jgi:hypothetical protein
MDFTKANPWLVGGLLFVTLDFLEGDGIDVFGVFAPESGPAKPASISIVGSNNNVNQGEQNSRNDSSNNSDNQDTAAPFFPPVSAGE